MQHQVDTLKFGDVAIGVEEAGRIERAGCDRQNHFRHPPHRQGAGAARRRNLIAAAEAIEIFGIRPQPRHIDLDGEVSGAVRRDHAAADPTLKVCILSHLPFHGNGGGVSASGRGPRP
ncbi:hypothetical protein D3C85_1566180 [compost metagenome]